jgi:hypothetical protein
METFMWANRNIKVVSNHVELLNREMCSVQNSTTLQ